jgi:hypothetical protein
MNATRQLDSSNGYGGIVERLETSHGGTWPSSIEHPSAVDGITGDWLDHSELFF